MCGLFFDIAKAFDRVWHDGLIYKMSKMGVPSEILKISKTPKFDVKTSAIHFRNYGSTKKVVIYVETF